MGISTDNSSKKPFAHAPSYVVTEDMGSEKVILDLQQSRYCSLNGVGSRMFALVQERPTLEEVVFAITEEYAADADTVRRDLLDLIDRLLREGLLVVNA
jgi:hypothetical protein